MDLYKVRFLEDFYYFSSGEEDVEFDNTIYTKSPIARSELTLELTDSDVRIIVPMSLEPFNYFVLSSPSAQMELTIIDYISEYELFNGILKSVTYKIESGTAELRFGRREAFFDSEVPYRTYGTFCSFDLYSSECSVLKNSHRVLSSTFTLSLDKKSANVPELAGVEDNTFKYGYAYTSAAEAVFITLQVGSTIFFDFPLIKRPTFLEIVKGCDKAFTTCGTKFNNSINFGGFPNIPAKNPVTESI